MFEKIKAFVIHNLKWIILFGCLIGFLALAEDVFRQEIMNGDIIKVFNIRFCYAHSKSYYKFRRSLCVACTHGSSLYLY